MIDDTLPLLLDGYLHLSERRRKLDRDTFAFRLGGQRAVCLVGQEATRRFYDPTAFDRQGVIPPPLQHTLFGDAAVHLLDGPAHHRRKFLFTSVLDGAGTAGLAASVVRTWHEALERWRGREIAVFDESAEILCVAVHAWAGVPLPPLEVSPTAAELVAMVDGFGSLGLRHVRARRARERQERRLMELVSSVRSGTTSVTANSPLAQVARHLDVDGRLLDEHTVAVELLNLLRPTVAVAWLLAYAAHALQHWPEERLRLADGGNDRAVAFAHEVRRFYPFTPFLGARAIRDMEYDGVAIPRDSMAVLDVFGQNHHPALWTDPWRFSSERYLEHPPGRYDLVPQGGGDTETGHRCPGEPATVQILARLAPWLAAVGHDWPDQDARITRHRIPARVRSGARIRVAEAR